MIDQKQMENAKYLNYFGSIIKIMQDTQVKLNPRIHIAKAAFNRKKILFST
jgi:hypothetical protein